MKFTSAEKPTGSSRTGLKSKAHLLKKSSHKQLYKFFTIDEGDLSWSSVPVASYYMGFTGPGLL